MTRPGRPPLDPDAPSVQVSVRLTVKQFDLAQQRADGARVTMAEWIRRVLAQGILHSKNRP